MTCLVPLHITKYLSKSHNSDIEVSTEVTLTFWPPYAESYSKTDSATLANA